MSKNCREKDEVEEAYPRGKLKTYVPAKSVKKNKVIPFFVTRVDICFDSEISSENVKDFCLCWCKVRKGM